jgi:hypothetical protein
VPTTTKAGLVRDDRRVRNSECEILQDGAPVARATMVQYRRAEPPRGEQWAPATDFDWPAEFAEGTSLVANLGTGGVGYINGDLTVALARLPVDEWMGIQADSHRAAEGISVGTATLFDRIGAFGSGLVTAVGDPAAQIDFANDPFPSRSP